MSRAMSSATGGDKLFYVNELRRVSPVVRSMQSSRSVCRPEARASTVNMKTIAMGVSDMPARPPPFPASFFSSPMIYGVCRCRSISPFPLTPTLIVALNDSPEPANKSLAERYSGHSCT
jgi:hypothetical protein